MRVLVTGASGGVGANVAEEAALAGHEVRVLVRKTSSREALRGIPCQEFVGDVLDLDSLPEAMEGCEAVFHVAGVYDPGSGGEDRMNRLHREGTRNVCRAASSAGVRRLIHTSSGITCAYGPKERPGRVGDDPEPGAADFRGPLRTYYLSKKEGEGIALEAGRHGRMETVVVHPCFVLGARDVHVTSGALIQKTMRSPIPLVPPGGNTFITGRDCARGHLGALVRGEASARYILGAWPLLYSEISQVILDVSGRRGPVITVPASVLRAAARASQTLVAAWPRAGQWVDPYTLPQLGKFRAWREERLAWLLGREPEGMEVGVREALTWYGRGEG